MEAPSPSANGKETSPSCDDRTPTAEGTPAVSTSSCQVSMQEDSVNGSALLLNKASVASGSTFVLLVSMLALPSVWPSLATLPLVLGAMVVLHVPMQYFPLGVFQCIFLYELLCSLVWYCYNIFCHVEDLPLSNVPNSFTWMERAGLQCYLREGPFRPSLRRYFFALGQGVALLFGAAFVRSRALQALGARSQADSRRSEGTEAEGPASPAGPADQRAPAFSGGFVSMWVRKGVALLRPITAAFIAIVTLGQEPANLLGVAYLLWLLCLVASGAMSSYVSAGWDALRASSAVWRSVLVLSNLIVLALFYCQVMESHNYDSFLGLQRSEQTVLEVTWAHLVVGVLAAIQAQALSMKIQIPSMYVNSNSALALFLWIGGIFIEMGIMLNLVMIQPFTVDSCLILLLCLGIVAVEQFDGSVRMRNWLLTTTAYTCAIILMIRYALLIPIVQEWISGPRSPLPKDQFHLVWKGFALADTRLEVRVKLGYLATLVPLSSGLRRVFRFGSEASLIGARSQVFLPKNTVLMTVLLEAARWSTVVLIFACYFIMPRHNATSHMQLAVLVLLLLSGRGWDYAGGFISLTSSVLLLVQYVYTFKLITFPDEEVESYWGLHNQGYMAEMALLLIGIIQRTVKRAALHCVANSPAAKEMDRQARSRSQRLRQETVAYSAQLGAAVLLLTALFCNSAWSVVYVGSVLLFRSSKDSRRCLSPSAANSWLRFFVLWLALSLATSLSFEAWLPPGIWKKPTADDVAGWFCQAYGNNTVLDFPATCQEEGCSRQHQCGKTWMAWLGLPSKGSTDVTLTFMALFCVCLLRHLCLTQLGQAKEERGRARSTTPEEDHAKGEDEAFGASPGPGEEDDSISQESASKQRCMTITPRTAVRWMSGMLNISLALAAVQQPHVSIISLGYLTLLVWHIFSMESVQIVGSSWTSRMRVNKWIRTYNVVVAFLLVCFQAPVVPCAYAVELAGCSEKTCPETFFVSPDVCRLLAAHDSTAWRAGWRPLTVLLQSLGVQKFREGVSFSWANLWIFVIFLISNLQALALERWEGDFQAENQNQIERIDLRERWYQEHLLHWRRLELRRIDTKHKVLLVKLRCLTGFITELRAIWQNRRGELTTQERSQRAREDRIHNLCLSSGLPPAAVQPVLEAFVQAAAKAAGPCGELLKMDSAPEECRPGPKAGMAEEEICSNNAKVVEVSRIEAAEEINQCVCEHLKDLQLQRLRRISAKEVSERKTSLLERCARAGEVVQDAAAAPQASQVQEGSATLQTGIPEEAAGEDAEVPTESDASALRRSKYRRQNSLLGDGFLATGTAKEKQALFADVKVRCLEMARGALGLLVDDFLYTYDPEDTLQSHRRHDSLAALLYKAFWSQTLPLLMIFTVVHFAMYTCVLSAVTSCTLVVSLMTFPHPHPRFWKGLIMFNLTIVLLKVLYQLPIFPTSFDYVQLKADMQSGFLNGVPVPWESVLGLEKVAPAGPLPGQNNEEVLVTDAVRELEERGLVGHSLLGLLWSDLLVCLFLVCHWHTLRHSGRLGNPAHICRRLALDDMRRKQQDPPTQKCEHGKRHLTVPSPFGPASRAPHKRLTATAATAVQAVSDTAAASSFTKALHRDARDCLDFAGLRKPAMDLFAPRAGLMMCCFCIVLISWNSLMDNRESFADSLSSSSFSGKQVMAVALFIGLLVEARAEYTWYTQHRSKGPDGWQFQAKEEKNGCRSETGGTPVQPSEERNLQPTMNLIMYFAQRIILLTELVTLHSFFIVRWSSSTTYQPRMTNSIQMLFYVFFMLYLALTSLQLRYDVHVTSGGLGLTHSMNFFYSVAFKAYLAVPFVEEMRVLTDWTVTRTSMDFFMWMKLEDAQQGLYRTKRDFHMRRWYPPAAARPTWEKVLQGGLLLVGLALLIVGPIALFSSLNPSLQSNRLTSGTLTATLLVQSSDQGIRKLHLFEGSQSSITADVWQHGDMSRMDTSNVTWVEESERSFDSTDPSSLAARITESLSDPDVTAWIEIEYVLLFNGDTSQSKRAELPPRRVKLSKNATLQLGRLVNESLDLSDIQEDPIFISQATTKTLRVSSNLEAQYTGKEMDFLLTFRSSEFGVHRHSHGRDRGSQLRAAPVRGVWLLSKASPECWAKQAGSSDSEGRGQARVDCRISQFVASEKSAPAPMGYSGSWGVMGIYLGVVYAVGRFLRLVFQDSSKRAIYEELPDVQLLQDLCNGIYIARIQHLLKTEFKLYYQLMNLFRSPELLLTVTGTFGAQKIDGEMDFLAELDDGHLGFDSAGTRVQSDPRLKAPETFGSLGTTAISPIPGSEQGSQETGEMPQASENTNVDDDLRQIQELQEELDHHFGDVPMPSVGRFAGVADSEMPLGDVTVATELRGGENPIPTSPTSELRRRHLQAAASSGNAGISTSSRLEM